MGEEECTPVSLGFDRDLKIDLGDGLDSGTSEADGVSCLLERAGFASSGDMGDSAVSTATLFVYLKGHKMNIHIRQQPMKTHPFCHPNDFLIEFGSILIWPIVLLVLRHVQTKVCCDLFNSGRSLPFDPSSGIYKRSSYKNINSHRRGRLVAFFGQEVTDLSVCCRKA
jgi:hypothetical protein